MNTQQVDFTSLYFGTPVAILSSQNADGSTNLSPVSSWWILEKNIVFGLGTSGKCYENIMKHPDFVLNIPDSRLWKNIEAMADKTGKENPPEFKRKMGYQFEKDKFFCASFNKEKSIHINPERIRECPVQIEAKVIGHKHLEGAEGNLVSIDASIICVHIYEELLKVTSAGVRFNVEKWKPLYYIFRHYFSVGEKLGNNFRCDD
ncbi:TPA: flavin reductase [Klebsiella aerogenes]|nr:flavin reductase [Klebsiella aerogenes]